MKNLDEKAIKIVSVSNNHQILDAAILSNPNVNKYEIVIFDNTQENIGIAKRYNSFIENNIDAESNFWVVFCHNDFKFDEDPYLKLEKMDKKCIYGPIGVKNHYNIGRLVKNKIFQKLGFIPSLKVNFKGLFSKEEDFLTLKKVQLKKGVLKSKKLGEIIQLDKSESFKVGEKIASTAVVSNLDCCCLIVHSSLISQYNLRFDENLDWHMYVEEFCIGAKVNYGIASKVVQLECTHFSVGELNEDFYKRIEYVKDKYSLKYLNTTCIDY